MTVVRVDRVPGWKGWIILFVNIAKTWGKPMKIISVHWFSSCVLLYVFCILLCFPLFFHPGDLSTLTVVFRVDFELKVEHNRILSPEGTNRKTVVRREHVKQTLVGHNDARNQKNKKCFNWWCTSWLQVRIRILQGVSMFLMFLKREYWRGCIQF